MGKTLAELQGLLDEFEAEYWDAPKDEESKTRHITLHMMKLVGRLGAIAEPREHGLPVDLAPMKEQIIPDLLYYALSLAAVHGVDVEKAFLERLELNRKKIQNWPEKSERQIKNLP